MINVEVYYVVQDDLITVNGLNPGVSVVRIV